MEDAANLEGPRSIAVPGAVAGLTAAHRALGHLPLDEVIAPAVELARGGFAPEFHDLMAFAPQIGKLTRYPELRRVFLPAGELPVGIEIPGPGFRRGEPVRAEPAKIRQPELADTLETIGTEGADGFYRGGVANRLVDAVQGAGGMLSHADLERYRPFHWQAGDASDGAPLEVRYRNLRVRVAPFASGGITSAMTLQLLDGTDLAACGHNTAEAMHRYICAARLAYADRFAFLADPESAEVPWRGLTSPAYAARRWETVGGKAPRHFKPGDPWQEEGRRAPRRAPGSAPAYQDGTTHLSVMDGAGNAVSLTNTLMSGFGSGVVAAGTGVILNNGMMWFDPVPGHVNSIAPRKLPLNNMSPLLVLDERGARLAVGASGGRRITNCVTNLVVKMLDFGLGPQQAIDAPRLDCKHAADRDRRARRSRGDRRAARPPPPRGRDRPALYHRGLESVRQPGGHRARRRHPARRRRHLPQRSCRGALSQWHGSPLLRPRRRSRKPTRCRPTWPATASGPAATSCRRRRG